MLEYNQAHQLLATQEDGYFMADGYEIATNARRHDAPAPARRNLAGTVVDDLSERIGRGALKPGDKLPTESEIMLSYGVSRAVVREAITQLQAARLVETRHGIGTFVLDTPRPPLAIDPRSVVTFQDVLQILELRISLEIEVALLAATRRTDAQLARIRSVLDTMQACRRRHGDTAAADADFHLAIAQAAGNEYFHAILQHLGRNIIPRSRISLAALTQEDLRRVSQEHEDIYEAIRRQDVETARAAMRSHLSNSRERLMRAYQGTVE
jgi:GntR family transcriptional regulator, transcriptional repressor for pyruvate dehydrogenase complex